jgi:hypothetical protein
MESNCGLKPKSRHPKIKNPITNFENNKPLLYYFKTFPVSSSSSSSSSSYHYYSKTFPVLLILFCY